MIWCNLLGKFTTCTSSVKMQKRVIRIMAGVGPRSLCRNLFRKLNILPVVCQYILSLTLFIVDNQESYPTNAYVRGIETRNRNHLHLPSVSLSCVQKGVFYSGARLFNNLPENIQNLRKDKKGFKNTLYGYLIEHSFYSINEFLEHKTDRNNISA